MDQSKPKALAGLLPFFLFFMAPGIGSSFEENNRFKPNTFPAKVCSVEFSIPLKTGGVLVILPASMEGEIGRLRNELKALCGFELEFKTDEQAQEADLKGTHLIIAGNFQNNRWARRLYLGRQCFADAYFPGSGGILIAPAKSAWNRDKNVLIIGYSRDEDGRTAFAKFLQLLEPGQKEIRSVRYLKTTLAFPKAPDDVEAVLSSITNDLVIFPPYRQVTLWGLAYHLSGDNKWADYFRAGCRALYERARKSGKWVSEPWTMLYFELWRFFLVWEMLDRDPVFSHEDRALVEELLWNYGRVLDGNNNFPHFRPDIFLPDDIRQNHTTFVALDLFCAHRYYREKYGMTDLEHLRAKFEPALAPQLKAIRSNDDAGFGYWTNLVFGYMYLAPNHALLYQALRGNESYLKESHLKKLADLLVTVTDNRRDGASFGDVSGYSPRRPGSPRGMTEKYLEIAAGASGDRELHWVYNWLAKDSGFELNNFFDGEYAVGMQEDYPSRFCGIHPVLLDDWALRWVSRRAEKKSLAPVENRAYLDKMSFRKSFDPNDEYLLLDGTSTFAHGHQDGNAVVRLTWKDRIWLFDLDYILHTPRYHNGVIVVRNGRQEEPPPLTSLEGAADFPEAGFSRTVCRDFNGADWERHIFWRKGRHFLFLDRIRAREPGEFRIETRWRTRGEVELKGTDLAVKQGDKEFRIIGGDESQRFLTTEKEGYWNAWDYPWGNKELKILNARKRAALNAGDSWVAAHLLSASDGPQANPARLLRLATEAWFIEDENGKEIAGLDPSVLAAAGITTDASSFLLDPHHLWLMNATYIKAREFAIEASSKFHLEIDFKSTKGILLVPPKNEGQGEDEILFKHCRPRSQEMRSQATEGRFRLDPGSFAVEIAGCFPETDKFFSRAGGSARPVSPEPYPSQKLKDFGLSLTAKTALGTPVRSFFPDGHSLLWGNDGGEVRRFIQGEDKFLWKSPATRPITVIHAADIDGDMNKEIVTADDSENLYVLSPQGTLLWSARLTKYMGENANAVDIAVAAPRPGKPLIFVGTAGFKLCAFDHGGRLAWEQLIRYHLQTKARVVQDGRDTLVAVGTVYSTPVNVLDAGTGKVRWFTWDQVGDEMSSTTDYCGVHLTDMVFIDADGDGSKEIVFGTKYNRVYALRLKDGSTVWEANVGDEVSVLRQFLEPASGEERLIVGTEAGDLVVLDRQGRRLQKIELESGIAAAEIIPNLVHNTVDILAATRDGRILVLDTELAVRGSVSLGDEVRGLISLGGRPKNSFLALAGRTVYMLDYVSYALRKSRFY